MIAEVSQVRFMSRIPAPYWLERRHNGDVGDPWQTAEHHLRAFPPLILILLSLIKLELMAEHNYNGLGPQYYVGLHTIPF